MARTIDALTDEIRTAVDASDTILCRIDGIGQLSAADILTEIEHSARFSTKAAFALANGTARIEAGSGRVRRHRLNRGCDSRQNEAIHTPALTQTSRPGTEGRNCCERCLARGKTKREAIRALKRRISDRIWTHLKTTHLT
ncbi:transposase [Candidatus Poriferisodalis sp.]|uniref:transposase n=1 Tax=Candidatus Poriferisodalis sp. TaxID=3101277 RepID=UPI003B524491